MTYDIKWNIVINSIQLLRMRAMRRQQYKKFCSFVAHQFCILIIFQNVWDILDFNVHRYVHLDFTDLDVD